VSFTYPLDDRQACIAVMADELAARFAERAKLHDREWSVPLQNYDDLHESGFLRLAIPAAYGGEGADVFDMVVAQEHLARGDAGTALFVGMLLNIIGKLRDDLTWPEPVFAEVCRTLAAEGGGINICVTEPDLGSISRGGVPSATATPTSGGWLINGRKIFITGASALRYFVTIVVLPPSDDAPHGEVASAIVTAGAPGLTLEDGWAGSLSLRTSGNCDVIYDNVFVPEAWVVERRPVPPPNAAPARPPGGKGAPGLGPWALTIAAVYLGVGEAAVRAACGYANSRVPSALGKPIAEQPHIQQWIGQMEVVLQGARAQLYETARLWRDHPDLREHLGSRIAAAKYLCTNAAASASETGLRVAGGFSLTGDLSLERHFRDARAGLFQPPQDDLALALIGRTALHHFKEM
jgi:alkylation response protein AidB-like acyl-CoA dehydrogenase